MKPGLLELLRQSSRVWRGLVLGLFALALLVVPTREVQGAVGVANINVGYAFTPATQVTFTINLTNISNDLLMVRVVHVNSNVSVTQVRMGTTNLTLQADVSSSPNATGAVRGSIWTLSNPPTGSQTITATFSGAVRAAAAGHQYSGVDTSNPIRSIAVNSSPSGTSSSVTLATVFGDGVVDGFGTLGSAGTITAGAGQNTNGLAPAGTGSTSADVAGGASLKQAVGTSTTVSWSTTNAAPHVHLALALRPSGPAISGTVFDDINYGGGAGRALASAAGAGRVANATVELYSSAGAYLGQAITDSNGAYTFGGLNANTTYHVRVVSGTVRTTRPCNNVCAGTVAGLTYRASATGGTVSGVTNFVGGTNPAVTDPGAATSSATFNTNTYVYSAGLSGTAHAVSAVQTGSAAVTGIDFGFSFNLVTNTNDSGQGSIRQYLANANEIVSTGIGMAQVGLTADIDNAVFMISNGSSAAGLRSTLDYRSSGKFVVNLVSPLPAFIGNVFDARRQPGWAGDPLVVLNGSALAAGSVGMDATNGATIAGFVVRNFPSHGLLIGNGLNVVQGNWVGLSNDGSAAAGNGGYGIAIYSGSADVVGGLTAADRNVIAGNGNFGLYIGTSSGAVVRGNYIGTNPAGTAAISNGTVSGGGLVVVQSSGTTVGGTASGAGNVISGNATSASTTDDGVWVLSSSGTTLQGNAIGTNAARNADLPNGRHGVFIDRSSGTTVGGTASGAANLIQGNASQGINIQNTDGSGAVTSTLNNLISANSISGNGGLGIDLGGDGVTANDGTTNANLSNRGMDFPVITAASFGSGSLTLAGYVGSAPGQTAFANAVVEFFLADAANTTANGEGRTYLGSLTADANGNFSGSINGLTGLSSSSYLTATARDGSGNTSEFSRNVQVVGPVNLSGTVFEDVNYGGGAGRPLSSAGTAGVSGATVELYNADGAFVSTTTTDANGVYTFSAVAPNTAYSVRVVNGTVRSTRSGSTASLVPVMTYRAQNTNGGPNAGGITNEVGGLYPAGVDSGALASGTTLWTDCSGENATCSFSGTKIVRYGANGSTTSGWAYAVATNAISCSNGVFGDPLTGTAKRCQVLANTVQSLTLARATTNNLSGLDFGFHFATVVNTNDSGQGSLRQALTNANTLGGDSGLAVAGRTAGVEHLAFMLPNATNAAGLRSAYNTFSGGVATVALASALPVLSTPLVVDAQTQAGWSNRPVVELNGAAAGAGSPGLEISAASAVTVRGLAIGRFGQEGIKVTGGSGHVIAGNHIGLNAAGTAAAANALDGIDISGATNVTVGGSGANQGNVISGNGSDGVSISGSGSTGHVLLGNRIGTNAAGTAAVPNATFGVLLRNGATGNTVGGTASGAGNLISGNSSNGVRVEGPNNTLQGNVIGMNVDLSAALPNSNGVVVNGVSGTQIGGTATGAGNVIAGNTSRGVAISGNASGNALRRNRIFGNGSQGIDLAQDGVTPNDGAKTAGQPNLLMDTPVISEAVLSGTSLFVSGHVGSAAGQTAFANATVEFFKVAADSTGYGQASAYLGQLTTSANGLFSGSFTVSGLAAGDQVTATATDASGNTSEFALNANAAALTVSGTVFEDVNYGGGSGRSRNASSGIGVGGVTVELYSAAGNFIASTTTSAGSYSFNQVSSGSSYFVRVVSSTVVSSRAGGTTSLRPVLTFRTNASSGTALADPDQVGGSNPAATDAPAGSSGAAFDPGSFIFTSGPTGTAQAVTPVTPGATPLSGLDFGFNFNTVVNTNDSGAGSLRQVLINANTLSNDGVLAVAGRTPGVEHVVFMLPNGTAGNGLRSAFNAFSGGVATLTPTTGLPAITGRLVVDAQTQPGWTLAPLVELNGSAAGNESGLVVNAANSVVRGFVINRFMQEGIAILGGSGTVIQNNHIGTDVSGTLGLGNGGDGIRLYAAVSNTTIGGIAAGQANLIRSNTGRGIGIDANSQGNLIRGNRILGNAEIGIDLGRNGATANDGAKDNGANRNMDAPVLTSASLAGTTLTVAGYVGSAPGQTTFAAATVDVYVSDGSQPAGQGRTWLGALTADANGNFSGSITGVSGLTLGSSKITATATDSSNNTSEFGPNFLFGYAIAGVVYEDLNYGGGAGRSRVNASGSSGRANARVELYTVASGSATFSAATTSDALGAYNFAGLAAGDYVVRVVPASVTSSRSGANGNLRAVPTFRTDASSGTAVDVGNAVGGTDPAASDPGNASSGAAFNTTSGLFTAGPTGTAQAFAPVTIGSATVTDVDFGFNFNTVVNLNNSGPGSLRQAMINANTLGGDSALAVAGRTAGVEHVIFMLPNGSAAPGLRASLNTFTGGVASIALSTGLPSVTAPLVIDAQTQPGWTANPLVELNGAAAGNHNGFLLTVAGSTVRGFVINRFNYSGIDAQAAATLQGNWIGLTASGSAAAPNNSHGILLSGSNNGSVVGGTAASQRNVLAGNAAAGLWIDTNTANHLVRGNYIGVAPDGETRIGNTGFYGVEVYGSGVTLGGTASGAGNVISGQSNASKGGVWLCSSNNLLQGNRIGTNAAGTAAVPNNTTGVVVCSGTSGNVIGGTASGAGNLVSGNGQWGLVLNAPTTVQGNTLGLNLSRSAALPNGSGGIWVENGGAGSSIGGTAAGAGNAISGNSGKGVVVNNGATGVALQTNAIWSNTGLAIDLGNNGITANDGAKLINSANLTMDAPVFTSARAAGTTLQVAGFVGSAAGQTLFGGARVEVFQTEGAAGGSGGGQVFLGALTADANGNFSGTLSLSAPLPIGTRLSATATDSSGNTSEFGPNFANVVFDLVVNSTGDEVDASAGDGSCLTASGVCTLRAALQELNAQSTLGTTPTIRFALPGCTSYGSASCRIAPATALPTMSRAMVVDGTTQPGFSTSRFDPIVMISGAAAPASTIGLVVGTNAATVRGLAFSGWGSHGLSVSGNGNTVVGSWFGLNGTGTAAAGNGGHGVHVTGSGNTLGGASAADRLVSSGNAQSGFALLGPSNTLKGSVAGLLADGQAAAANTLDGVYLSAANQVIGGAAAGEGNVLSGNGRSGVRLDSGSNGTVVYGNLIGVAADGSTARGNGNTGNGSGVGLLGSASGITLGGTGPGQGNLIAHSVNSGVGVGSAGVQRVRISGNRIYANGTLGIRTLSGSTPVANDGATNSGQANNGMDHPVITGAGVDGSGGALLVYGVIGTGAGQAAFAGATVEFFKAEPDPSGYGEGKTYLGSLTADANGAFTGTLNFPAGTLAVGDAITATATDGLGNSSEFGPNWTTTSTAALAPGRFEAFDAATASGATSGPITSKVAGAPASYAVIALDSAGTALHPGFTGTVTLTWVDARNDSGVAVGSCRSSWIDLGPAGTATFSSNSRVTVALSPPASATRVMRLKMSYAGAGGSGPVTACSGDAFAALPASLSWIGASDADPATAGTTRSLANTSASGGVVHRAGRPFTVRAQALSATGALMSGYDGSPVLATAGCLLPSGCTAGVLSAPTVVASAGTYTHNTVSYAEVGAVQLQLTDSSYADVDSGDTSSSVRTLTSGLLSVGRFVPDAYTLTLSTSGQFATANAACMAAGSGATFLGQTFTWATPPQVTVTAINAAGATTTGWTGSLMKLASSTAAPALAVSGAGTATLSTSFGSLAVSDLGGGQARLTASTNDRFLLDLAAGAVQDTTTPGWIWSLNLSDASEAGVAGNPTLTASASQSGVGFNSGNRFHSGRLALQPAYGDVRVGPRALVQLQRYTAAGWVTMTEDQGCVTVAPQNLGIENPSGVFATAGVCAAPMSASVSTRGGRAWLALAPSPDGSPGRLQLRLAGPAATGTACNGTGSPTPVVPLSQAWLLGGSASSGPSAWATWGRPQRDALLRRETW